MGIRTFERSCLLCAELKVDSIRRGDSIGREDSFGRGSTMQGATMRKWYALGARKEVRIVKNNER